MTSAADRRWHEIPSPQGRIARLENVIMNISMRITEANLEIAKLRERVEQLELEQQHREDNYYLP